MQTVVIGLGNTLLSDDGVGPVAISRLRREVADSAAEVFKTASVGGIELMTELVGFDRAIIVDAIATGQVKPGTIHRLNVDDLISTRNLDSTHDSNLGTALELGKMLGLQLPEDIKVWGVEAHDLETFGEDLSPQVASALPQLISEIRRYLKEPFPSGPRAESVRSQ
jgi:hydrogenase maturation protease